jgi:chromosome partitioning protein
MGETVAFVSQKGGTGKTTAVRTLFDVFERLGLHSLAVDLDPQGNLSDYFDLPSQAGVTVGDVLLDRAKAEEAVDRHVIPSNLGLAEAELVLGSTSGREMALQRALTDLKKSYDLVLVDCPPSLGLLTINALVAADCVVVSAQAQYFALQGVEQALEVIELTKQNLQPDLDWLGVVPNMCDIRTVHARQALEHLRQRFGDKVFDSVIRQSIRYAESSERGVSILDHASTIGADYLDFAGELLNCLGHDKSNDLQRLHKELATH